MTPWSQLCVSGHVKGHVDGRALLRRRAASGLDVGHPSQWCCRRCSGIGRRTSVHTIFE